MDHAEGFETSYDANLTDEDQKGRRRRFKCHCFPKRYIVALLCCLGFVNLYSLTLNLSVVLVAMVSNQTILNENGSRILLNRAEFNWDTKLQGVILSSFFYGYISTQIPGGYLATKYGGKYLFGGGIVMKAVLTLLTPLATRTHVYLLIAVRICEGVFGGFTYPAMFAIWSKWAPPLERSTLVTISISGQMIGSVFSMTISGFLADSYGWTSVFYVFGSIALIWGFFWFYLVSDSPQDHPTISQEELDYITESLGNDNNETKIRTTPWREIFTSLPVLALVVASVSYEWGYVVLMTYVPTYLKTVLHFDLKQAGYLAALPFLLMVLVIPAGGRLADFLRSQHILSTTKVRKLFTSLGLLTHASFLVAVGYGKDKDFPVFGLTMAAGLGGLAWSGFPCGSLDVAPCYAGIITSISNCIGLLSGILAPISVGFIATHNTQAEWRIVFYMVAAIDMFGVIFYLMFASGEKQPWADYDGYGMITTDEAELAENYEIVKESSRDKSQ